MSTTNKFVIDEKGRVKISSPALSLPQVKEWLEPYKLGKVKGNMYYAAHNDTLQFEPITARKHPPKVKAKTFIANSQVAIYKDMVKISTSLPLSMSKEEMDLSLAEENHLIERAFMLGLCRALVLQSLNQEEEESNATI